MIFVIENVISKWMNDFFIVNVLNDFGISEFNVILEERNFKVYMFGIKKFVEYLFLKILKD